jgi:hypothetical protein
MRIILLFISFTLLAEAGVHSFVNEKENILIYLLPKELQKKKNYLQRKIILIQTSNMQEMIITTKTIICKNKIMLYQ